jgi:hypothetical protein
MPVKNMSKALSTIAMITRSTIVSRDNDIPFMFFTDFVIYCILSEIVRNSGQFH